MAEINDRLMVSLEANVSKLSDGLDKAIAKMNATSRAAYGAASKVQGSLDSVQPTKIQAALDSVFDNTRLKVLDTGAARVGLFGSAFEKLGPAGLVAAGGVGLVAAAVGAFTAAMDRTEKAIDAGAEIAKMAKTWGTSADFVQEFNFALRQSEIDVAAGDKALVNLGASLGAVQKNLAKKQQVRVFEALGFTPDALRQFHDVGDFFPVLAERIGQVQGAAEKTAIAKRLGIEELLPLLNSGAAGFSSLAKEARDLGVVLDASTIVKAEEAKKKLAEISDVMKTRANAGFLEFADTLIFIRQKFLEAEMAGLHMLAALTNTETPNQRLQEDSVALASLASAARTRRTINGENPNSPFDAYEMAQYKALKADVAAQNQAKQVLAAANARANAGLAGGGGKGVGSPVPDAAKKGPRDDTAERSATADATLAEAQKAAAEAFKGLTSNIDKLADFELEALHAQTTAELDKIDKQKAEIEDDKGISSANKDILEAKLDQAKRTVKAAADAKAEEIGRKRISDLNAAEIADREFIVGQYDRIAANAASLATTLDQRRSIELRQQGIDQDLELRQFDKQAAEDLSSGKRSASTIAADRASLLDRQKSDKDAKAAELEAPVDQYLRSIKDLNTEIQDDGVQAFKSLSDSLGQSAANALGLKGALGQFFANLISQLVQYEFGGSAGGLIKGFAGLFTGFHASGGYIPPGTWGIAGEAGAEPVFGGTTGLSVLPNSVLRAGQNINAPQAGGMGGGGAVTVHLQVDPSPYFDARVVTLSGPIATQVADGVFRNRSAQAGRRHRLGS